MFNPFRNVGGEAVEKLWRGGGEAVEKRLENGGEPGNDYFSDF
ncbi:MAG TPA: hypothetical protein VFD23_02605 [Clostridia bacterium]|nr:hypothetical protein [Clostridia bacterium]